MKINEKMIKMDFNTPLKSQNFFYICKKDFDSEDQRHYVHCMHWHDDLELAVILGGEGKTVFNGVETDLAPGDVFLLSYNDCHDILPTKNLVIYNLNVYQSFLGSDLLKYTSGINNLSCHIKGDELSAIVYLCKKLISLQEKYEKHQRDMDLLSAKLLISNLFMLIINKSHHTPKHIPSQIQKIVEYINHNLEKDLTLKTVASVFSVSANYMGKVFQKSMQMTYNEYINKARLRHACALLMNSSIPIKEIAEASGYGSIEHFYYVFKKYMLSTPTEYRKRINGINS